MFIWFANFYQCFFKRFNKIAVPLILILKINLSSEIRNNKIKKTDGKVEKGLIKKLTIKKKLENFLSPKIQIK